MERCLGCHYALTKWPSLKYHNTGSSRLNCSTMEVKALDNDSSSSSSMLKMVDCRYLKTSRDEHTLTWNDIDEELSASIICIKLY